MNPLLGPDTTLAAVAAALVGYAVLEPISPDEDEARLWMDADLASLVENRFHVALEPAALTESERRSWMQRAVAPDERILDPRERDDDASFWILDAGRRAGTLAVETFALHPVFLRLSSLYVLPAFRHRGVAARVLRAAQAAAVAGGLDGVRVTTFWTWQRAVRWYLSLGMWACSFKRSIDFMWSDSLPAYVIEAGVSSARFSIVGGAGEHVELIAASRDGDRLVWHESPRLRSEHETSMLPIYASATFAVALALECWPLLRSRERFDEAKGWDLGGPEVLAQRIAVFEHLDRRHGFDVRTPVIPGLPYEEIAELLDDGRS